MMSDEFKLSDDKFDAIVEAFSSVITCKYEKSRIKLLYREYQKYSPFLQEQYLAHAMRALECYFRNIFNNKRFIVYCEPYTEVKDNQKPANAKYYPPSLKSKDANKKTYKHPDAPDNCYIINYDPSLRTEKDKLKLRNYIAHEIGHLFWDAIIRNLKPEQRQMLYIDDLKRDDLEPISSILGIFIMSEKHDFYANIATKVECHTRWNNLLKFFKDIVTPSAAATS